MSHFFSSLALINLPSLQTVPALVGPSIVMIVPSRNAQRWACLDPDQIRACCPKSSEFIDMARNAGASSDGDVRSARRGRAMDDTLSAARRSFAEELQRKAQVRRNPLLIEAFAAVPRERFVGPAPWRIIPYPFEAFVTDDPLWLYRDNLVSIDASRNLSNGLPSFWARALEQIDIARGERVLQVGAGTGYFSAVLGEIVGANGQVTAVEIDPELASQARTNLSIWPQIEVISGDGHAVKGSEFDAVIVFAGCTHPSRQWLDGLAEGGRLLMPLTNSSWRGFLLRAIRRGNAFEASSIGIVHIYPCMGERDCEAGQRLEIALQGLPFGQAPVCALHLAEPAPDVAERVWYQAPGFWLERAPVDADSGSATGPVAAPVRPDAS